eukprot:14367-Heterococcus_DN1.PRE.1
MKEPAAYSCRDHPLMIAVLRHQALHICVYFLEPNSAGVAHHCALLYDCAVLCFSVNRLARALAQPDYSTRKIKKQCRDDIPVSTQYQCLGQCNTLQQLPQPESLLLQSFILDAQALQLYRERSNRRLVCVMAAVRSSSKKALFASCFYPLEVGRRLAGAIRAD